MGAAIGGGLGLAGAGFQMIGGVMDAIGSIRQGKAAVAQSKWMAQQAVNNMQIRKWASQDALAQGLTMRQQLAEKAEQYKSNQRTRTAAQGMVVGEGTPLQKIADTAMLANYDSRVIDYEAKMKAWGFDMEASEFAMQAKMSLQQGQQAMQAARWGAATGMIRSTASALGAAGGAFSGNGGGGGGGTPGAGSSGMWNSNAGSARAYGIPGVY